jgi:hypothetical protein
MIKIKNASASRIHDITIVPTTATVEPIFSVPSGFFFFLSGYNAGNELSLSLP